MEQLASVPGVRFSVGATAHARVTKVEWYDRLILDDGRVAVMFGHIPRGLNGGRSRSTLERMRGAAGVAVEQGAASAIAALHRYARHDNSLEGAAVCVAVLNPVTGELACSSAGWPGPWLMTGMGSVRQLQSAGIGPLGSDIAGDLPVESVFRVHPGDHILLHAARSTDTRARMVLLLEQQGPEDPQAICDALDAHGDEADGQGPHALLLSFVADGGKPEALTVEVPAEAHQLPGLRDRLSNWLTVVDCPDEMADRLVLAMNEAATNSIVHAYQDMPAGSVRLRAEVERDRSIRVMVSDDGHWRPAVPGERPGGRGVLMMQECADRVRIDRREDGTTVTLEVQYHALPVPRGGAGMGLVEVPRRHRLVVRNAEGTTVAHLSGDVPDSAAATLRRQLLTATCGGVVPLVVDLGELGTVAEGVVHALVDVARAADGAGERVVVVAPDGSRAAEEGTLAGLGNVVELVSTIDDVGLEHPEDTDEDDRNDGRARA